MQRVEPVQGFVEYEQAFGRAYRSYRANGRPRMDVDTFFSRIRGELISLITRELTDLNSVRVQMTTWIRFTKDDDRVELAFNSRMTDVHRGNDLDQAEDIKFHLTFQLYFTTYLAMTHFYSLENWGRNPKI